MRRIRGRCGVSGLGFSLPTVRWGMYPSGGVYTPFRANFPGPCFAPDASGSGKRTHSAATPQAPRHERTGVVVDDPGAQVDRRRR